MNNNMNEQNNQGMNNVSSTNGPEAFANNLNQPTNQSFMNNNLNQNNPSNMNTPNYKPNNNGKNNNKIIMIIAIVVGIVVVIFVLMNLLSKSSKNNTSSSTSTDTSNQSVYKTIDFSSYSGDSKSTEFDTLVNKKVTFTNVNSFGGTLGSMTKMISCDNESSFTLEDDAKYTVTGIVSYNIGTYSVNLKDCTITKS